MARRSGVNVDWLLGSTWESWSTLISTFSFLSFRSCDRKGKRARIRVTSRRWKPPPTTTYPHHHHHLPRYTQPFLKSAETP